MVATLTMFNAYAIFGDCVPPSEFEHLNFNIPVYLWTPTNPDIPRPRLNFPFDHIVLRRILQAIACDFNMVIAGPPGYGKTSTLIEIASRLGRPFHRFPVNDAMTTPRDIDSAVVRSLNDLHWAKGPLAYALDQPSMINFDGVDRLHPVLHPTVDQVCDRRRLPSNGETVLFPPGHIVIATISTNHELPDLEVIKRILPESTRERFPVWINFPNPLQIVTEDPVKEEEKQGPFTFLRRRIAAS